MFVLIFTDYAMVRCCLPNKSAQTPAVSRYSDTFNATVSLLFSCTEEYLTSAREIALNVSGSQQSQIPEVLSVPDSVTAHGQLSTTSSSVPAPAAGRKALPGGQKSVQDGNHAAEGFLELLP